MRRVAILLFLLSCGATKPATTEGESTEKESFRDGLLEEPVYTRPAEFRGWGVPEVLISGDHGRIEEWRSAQRRKRTAERRPDLLSNGEESDT